MNPVLTDDEQSAYFQRALRDTFAAAALTGLLADPSVPLHDTAHLTWAADRAYALADAMLVRRAQPPTPLSSAPSQAAGGDSKPQPQ